MQPKMITTTFNNHERPNDKLKRNKMAFTKVAVNATPLKTLFSIERSLLYKPTKEFRRLMTWAKFCHIGFSQRHKRMIMVNYYKAKD